MNKSRKCGKCMFWESMYDNNADLGDHQSGTCSWLSHQIKPMWLSPSEAIVKGETLAGAGHNCEAWSLKPSLAKSR